MRKWSDRAVSMSRPIEPETGLNDAHYQTLTLDTDARGVARLQLNKPATLNAFDEAMIAELAHAFEALDADAAVRAVVLGASGRAFSAGADLRWMERASRNAEAANLEDARRFAGMMQRLYACRKPVIARVQGAAYGGGVGLCCACDIVFAVPQARFAVSEAKFGILPSVIGPYLNNAVGKRQALRLALTAEIIDAARAAQIGLVHEVVEAERIDAAIEAVIAQLLGNGPAALGEIKQLFSRFEIGAIDAGVRELTAQTIARVRSGDEAREGFAAFLAKRPAAWLAPATQGGIENTAQSADQNMDRSTTGSAS
jgi:methylglutaconyl-CoA hydratase